jgi:basic amino acid/polyamine antiporter, APA family
VAAITLFITALTTINIRGVARGAMMSNILTCLKLAPLLLVAAGGLWASRHMASIPLAQPAGHLGEAMLVAFFACMGFESGAVIAGEVGNPRRDVAAGILGGIGGVALIYTLLMIACLRGVPDLAHAARPLAAAAEALLGTGGATVVSITAVLSCAGSLSVWMIASPRVLYALGASRDLPPVFARISHARHTPVVAILTSAVLVWLLTVSRTFVYLATFSAMSRLLMYGSTCAALIALRRQDGPAPIPIPFGRVLSVVALLAALAAIAATTGAEIRDLAIALGVGWIARMAVRRSNARTVPADIVA